MMLLNKYLRNSSASVPPFKLRPIVTNILATLSFPNLPEMSWVCLKGFGLARIPILATAYGPVYTDYYVVYNAYSG